MTPRRASESQTWDQPDNACESSREAQKAALDRADLRELAVLTSGFPAPLKDASLEGALEMKRAAEANAALHLDETP